MSREFRAKKTHKKYSVYKKSIAISSRNKVFFIALHVSISPFLANINPFVAPSGNQTSLHMPPTKTFNIKVFLVFGITIFFWSSAFVAIRIALKSYSPGSLALFRYIIASLGMAIIHFNYAKVKLHWRDVPFIVLIGVIGFGVYNVALNYGEVTVSAGIAGFMIGQMPVAITVLAIVFLGERPCIKALIGLVISVIGITLIAISHQRGTIGFDLGILYLIIAVLSGATYHVSYKKLLHRYQAIELTAYGIWFGTLSMLFYAPDLWKEIPLATPTATWLVIYLGIFPGLLGYLCWNYGLKYVSVSKASSGLYFIPIVTLLLGWLCLDEIPVWLALIGGLVALGGAIMVATSKRL